MPDDSRVQRVLNLENPIDRRQFMKAVGVGGAATLAGCSGDSPAEDQGSPADSNPNTDAENEMDESNAQQDNEVLSTVIGGEIAGNLYGSTNLIIETATANSLLWSSLMTRDPETGEMIPDAAANLPEIENDGTTFRFDLKEDITFHDGTNLTAQDVKYSFDVLQEYDLEHAGKFDFENIEIEDDYRITFQTAEPNAPWVGYSVLYFSIIREGIAEEVDSFPDDLNNGPVNGCNSGPYDLAEYRPQTIARFEAYDDYHEDGVPAVDQIEIEVMPEASSQNIAIRNDDVDILGDPSPKDFQPLVDSDGVTGDSRTNLLSRITIYLSHKPPFDNVHLRKAANYAINREAIIENILYGQGFASSIPAPPDTWFYNEEADYYGNTPQPDKVQEHLEKGGQPDGFSFELMASAQQPIPDTATILQQNFREVGIDMSINQVSPGSFYGEIASQNYTAGLEFWNSIVYPGYYMEQLFTDFGDYQDWHRWGKYGDTEEARAQVSQELREARKYSSRENRAPHLKAAQQILADQVPYLWVGGQDVAQVWREGIENYHVLPTVWQNLRRVDKTQ